MVKKIVFFVCLTQAAWSQQPALNMQNYLSALQAQDIEYQRVLKDLDQLEFNKDLNMPSRQYLLEIQNEYGIVLGDGQTTRTLGTSLSRNFSETGTQVSVFFDDNELIGRDERTIGARVEQDLLRNSFGSTTRAQSDMLDIENQILYLQIVQAYEDYVETKMQAFVTLQKAYLELQAAENLQQQSQKIQQNIVERRRNNIALDVDVDRITLQNLVNEESLMSAQAQVRQQAQALELTLGYPVDLSKGLQPWDMPMPTLDRVTELVPSTRTMQIAALQEKALTQSAFLAKRQRYPDLNLVLGITRDEFTRFNVAADRNELVVGFNVSAPLGDSQLKAQEKSARLTAALASTDRELTQRDLKLNLQTLAIDIQNQEKVHAIAQKKLKVSTRIVDQEKLRYNRGQIDLEQWIDAQNTLKDNQLQAIESAVDLTSLILQWQNLSDQLVQKDDVTTTPQ